MGNTPSKQPSQVAQQHPPASGRQITTARIDAAIAKGTRSKQNAADAGLDSKSPPRPRPRIPKKRRAEDLTNTGHRPTKDAKLDDHPQVADRIGGQAEAQHYRATGQEPERDASSERGGLSNEAEHVRDEHTADESSIEYPGISEARLSTPDELDKDKPLYLIHGKSRYPVVLHRRAEAYFRATRRRGQDQDRPAPECDVVRGVGLWPVVNNLSGSILGPVRGRIRDDRFNLPVRAPVRATVRSPAVVIPGSPARSRLNRNDPVPIALPPLWRSRERSKHRRGTSSGVRSRKTGFQSKRKSSDTSHQRRLGGLWNHSVGYSMGPRIWRL